MSDRDDELDDEWEARMIRRRRFRQATDIAGHPPGWHSRSSYTPQTRRKRDAA